MTVKAIPDGYHSITPFMNIKDASAAIELYKAALGAEERGRMAMPNGAVAHAELKVGDSILMISEAMQNAPTASSHMLYVNDADAAFARAVAAGMTVTMPVADMFWGDRYGLVVDRFGNRWGFATHKEDVSPDELARRGREAMAAMKP